MPRGQPDYGMYAVKKTVGSLADMAELAARLGSIVTFDRRGDVIWYDDFESDLQKWTALGGGVGGDVVLSAEAARSGAFSCKLTTGITTGDLAKIERLNPYPVISKTGLECSFSLHTDIDYLWFWLQLYGYPTRYDFAIRYSEADHKLQYWNNEGEWADLATDIFLRCAAKMFNTIKFVADPETGYYVRCILNQHSYDMSEYKGRALDGAAINFIWLEIKAVTAVDNNLDCYIDDVILTQNEP